MTPETQKRIEKLVKKIQPHLRDIYLTEFIKKDLEALVTDVEREAREIDENTSDGYHTFKELYEHRHTLFVSLMNLLSDTKRAEKAWKSNKHHDGSMYDGWFIAGIGIEKGDQITYHLPLKYWDKLKTNNRNRAPKWDGHTSKDVIDRLTNLLNTK